MSVHGVPVCNIRYCHRPPASWILAGFALLARDGVLKLGQVVRSEQFLKQNVYAHNSIVEAEIEGERIVFDYENGYQSFLRPELFDTQIGSVRAYFKCNYDPSRFEGMKNKDKVHPFIAGMYTGTCAGNPYDRVGLLDNGLSVKGLRAYLSNLRHRAEYLKQYDYTLAECSSSFPSYSVLFWSRLNEEGTSVEKMQRIYPFLDEAQAKELVDRHMQMLHDVNVRRVLACTVLKREFGDLFIGGIEDGAFARRNVPDLITHDERVSTRRRFLETMHGNVIGVVTSGHQYCIGARFGELLASGRAIITDPIHCVLPGGCTEGRNYLVFRNAKTLGEHVEYLLHNVDAVHEMERQNRTYYAESFNPRACVRSALQTAFPEYEVFKQV